MMVSLMTEEINLAALWCEVVMQARDDLFRIPTISEANKRVNVAEAAKKWFFSNESEKDFFLVCEFANLEPELIRQGIKDLLDLRNNHI